MLFFLMIYPDLHMEISLSAYSHPIQFVLTNDELMLFFPSNGFIVLCMLSQTYGNDPSHLCFVFVMYNKNCNLISFMSLFS